jgi:hypothetical protein
MADASLIRSGAASGQARHLVMFGIRSGAGVAFALRRGWRPP